jgi:DNA-binding NtrC family response regulator
MRAKELTPYERPEAGPESRVRDRSGASSLAESEPTTEKPASSLRCPRVLVVDDDAALRDSLVRVLSEVEIEAIGARSALHALGILAEQEIDVIVSEEFLAGIPGNRLLELSYEQFPEVCRVLFTAHGSSDILLAAINQGHVSKVLLKNMHAVTIREEINRVALEALRKRMQS